MDKVYATSVVGYDPDLRADVQLQTAGVDELRADIIKFLVWPPPAKGPVYCACVHSVAGDGRELWGV